MQSRTVWSWFFNLAGRMQCLRIGMVLAAIAVTPARVDAAAPAVAEAIPINIGFPVTNYWPLLVARDLHLFEKAGLAPHFFPFTTGAPLAADMQSGRLDVAWTGLATVFMLGKGIPLRFVLVAIDHSSQMRLLVSPDAAIASYKDLKLAKAIGVPAGTCSEVSALLAARKAGIPYAALNVVNLAPNLMRGALQNHQIDSAFIWGPWDLQLRGDGVKAVSADKDYVPDGSVCGVTVAMRPAYMAQHPGVGCRMVRAHALALEAVRDNPDLAIRAIQKASGLSYELSKESFETLEIPSIASLLEPKAAWSLTNETGGLTKKLLLAGDALYQTRALAKPLSAQMVWDSVDAQPVREFLTTGCR